MRSLHGVIPILPVPFQADGAVDEVSFRRVVDVAIEDGAHALAMFGLASEYAKLADSERELLTEALIDQADHRVPVIVSITPHSLEVAVQQAAEAERRGADAIMVLPPFFLSPSVGAVRAHLRAVADSVSLPVIVQYAPAQTGTTLRADDFGKIQTESANLQYVKVDASPSGPLVSQLHALGFHAMVGYMGLHLPDDHARGAVAVMPTVSVVCAFVHLWKLLETKPDEAREFHQQILPLLNFMMQSVELLVAVEKVLLVERGVMEQATCRSPGWQLDEFQIRTIMRFRQQHGAWLDAPANVEVAK